MWLLWLIIPLLIVAIGSLACFFPIRIVARYDGKEAGAWLWLGPVKYQLYPEEEEKKKPLGEKHAKSANGEASDDTIIVFFEQVKKAVELLLKLREHLTVKKLEFKLILAGGDPAELAVNYGRAWATLGNLIPQLERFLCIKKRDLEVECDFTAPKTKIYAYADLRIPLNKAIYVLYKYSKIKEKVV